MQQHEMQDLPLPDKDEEKNNANNSTVFSEELDLDHIAMTAQKAALIRYTWPVRISALVFMILCLVWIVVNVAMLLYTIFILRSQIEDEQIWEIGAFYATFALQVASAIAAMGAAIIGIISTLHSQREKRYLISLLYVVCLIATFVVSVGATIVSFVFFTDIMDFDDLATILGISSVSIMSSVYLVMLIFASCFFYHVRKEKKQTEAYEHRY